MARRVDRLTDKKVRSAKAGMHADGLGLYLQVSPGGSRSWIYRFKVNGKARDMGLGSYGEGKGVGLAEARQKAKEARQHRDAGKDPIAERDAAAAQKRLADARTTTFEECAEQLIEPRGPAGRTPSTSSSGATLWPPTHILSSATCPWLMSIPSSC